MRADVTNKLCQGRKADLTYNSLVVVVKVTPSPEERAVFSSRPTLGGLHTSEQQAKGPPLPVADRYERLKSPPPLP
jgi:hypothetical protein